MHRFFVLVLSAWRRCRIPDAKWFFLRTFPTKMRSKITEQRWDSNLGSSGSKPSLNNRLRQLVTSYIMQMQHLRDMRQIHAGCASHPRIRRKCCRARSDVTFGPLSISMSGSVIDRHKTSSVRIHQYRDQWMHSVPATVTISGRRFIDEVVILVTCPWAGCGFWSKCRRRLFRVQLNVKCYLMWFSLRERAVKCDKMGCLRNVHSPRSGFSRPQRQIL
jgi:hypothetical protein